MNTSHKHVFCNVVASETAGKTSGRNRPLLSATLLRLRCLIRWMEGVEKGERVWPEPASSSRRTPSHQKFGLPRPEAIFDLEYFRQSPEAFYCLAKELWPGKHKPTLTHHFLKLLAGVRLCSRSEVGLAPPPEGAPHAPEWHLTNDTLQAWTVTRTCVERRFEGNWGLHRILQWSAHGSHPESRGGLRVHSTAQTEMRQLHLVVCDTSGTSCCVGTTALCAHHAHSWENPRGRLPSEFRKAM